MTNKLKPCNKWNTASFPLKTHTYPTPSIQPQIWKCFPCTASSKFGMLRLLLTRIIIRVSSFRLIPIPVSHNTSVTDRQTDKQTNRETDWLTDWQTITRTKGPGLQLKACPKNVKTSNYYISLYTHLTPKIKPVNPGFWPLSNPGLRVWKRPGLPGFSGTRVTFPNVRAWNAV